MLCNRRSEATTRAVLYGLSISLFLLHSLSALYWWAEKGEFRWRMFVQMVGWHRLENFIFSSAPDLSPLLAWQLMCNPPSVDKWANVEQYVQGHLANRDQRDRFDEDYDGAIQGAISHFPICFTSNFLLSH
uniref:Putative secreted peptide n=1 Tax=Anopheles braziliensis TaxID=58242 RepID=A0A2M3ZWQ7_9DIPT